MYRTAHSNYEITLERESSYEQYFKSTIKRFYLRLQVQYMSIDQQEGISVKRYCMSFKKHFVQNICKKYLYCYYYY